jgi:hypothetical protein
MPTNPAPPVGQPVGSIPVLFAKNREMRRNVDVVVLEPVGPIVHATPTDTTIPRCGSLRGVGLRDPGTTLGWGQRRLCGGVGDAVEKAAATRVSTQVLARLHHVFPRLQASHVLPVVERLFLNPALFENESAALIREQISAAALNSHLSGLGLQSLRALRRAARGAAAFQLIRRHRILVKQVAIRTGCGSVDTLERDVARLTQLSPTDLADRISDGALLDLIVRACCAKPPAAHSARAERSR